MQNKLSKMEILTIGLMLFSIFFGAGNLIFPPVLGQAAGTHLLPAIVGFLVTGVGLPLLGVLAIGLAHGAYPNMIADRVHPIFAVVLISILNLTIGPLFAIPRTGAVAFEVGIRSFLGEEHYASGQFAYTLIFFGVTYFLALNPSRIVDRVGKVLTPLLLFFMALLFIRVFYAPLGELQAPNAGYAAAPFLAGFQEGYLTMDLLAFIAIGSIVINSIRAKGIEKPSEIGRICIRAGLISATLMSMVYLALSYLGASSAAVLGQSENGGVILTAVSKLYFGQAGSMILAAIISFACLTTSCGLASSCAWYFNKLSKGRIQYQRLLLAITIFSMAAANIGLTGLIAVSVPFLVALYPLVIVLVLLTLADPLFKGRKEVYRCSLFLTLAFSCFSGLNAAGVPLTLVDGLFARYIPLYSLNLGWIFPAVIGVLIGLAVSGIKRGAAGVE